MQLVFSHFWLMRALMRPSDLSFPYMCDLLTNCTMRLEIPKNIRIIGIRYTTRTHFQNLWRVFMCPKISCCSNSCGFDEPVGVHIPWRRFDKSLLEFCSLDGTNTMSGEHGGLARQVRHAPPHCIYLNCRNHRLALCLVHLLRVYPDLQHVDELMLTLWKFFKNSSVRAAVVQNAQEVEGLRSLKILRASVVRWLTHGKTAVRIITRFPQLIQALDALYSQRNENEAKGIRDKLLRPNNILMLLVLAEALVPINFFSSYLQSLHINYLIALDKFERCVQKAQTAKGKNRSVRVQSRTDCSLKIPQSG